jgi:hypothetical protein
MAKLGSVARGGTSSRDLGAEAAQHYTDLQALSWHGALAEAWHEASEVRNQIAHCAMGPSIPEPRLQRDRLTALVSGPIDSVERAAGLTSATR